MSAKERIGFIGTGIMGEPMARNLLKAGYDLCVFNRSREKLQGLLAAGAREGRSPTDVARQSDVVITIVTDTPDVDQVLFGTQGDDDGVASGAAAGTVVIDMSTIAPEATRRFAARLRQRGIDMLDAPVSGGDVGARQGTLTIMVGGEAEVVQRCLPILRVLGSRITHVGPSGAGQTVKLCNQILCAVNLVAVCEALAVAKQAGLDLATFLHVVTGGAANSWSLEHLGPKIAAGDLQPGFMVRLMQKDLAIALQAAKELRVPLPGTALAQQLLRGVEALEGQKLGTQAMILTFEKLGNFQMQEPPR
ncbi:MAG: NAD(P)-dependent oxidoreductase [Candidatus Tectomicrobia bacterium]|nr:NAD(P)-dependent oxidoreductase [Candidatus Tectomicrobia bacterium]